MAEKRREKLWQTQKRRRTGEEKRAKNRQRTTSKEAKNRQRITVKEQVTEQVKEQAKNTRGTSKEQVKNKRRTGEAEKREWKRKKREGIKKKEKEIPFVTVSTAHIITTHKIIIFLSQMTHGISFAPARRLHHNKRQPAGINKRRQDYP